MSSQHDIQDQEKGKKQLHDVAETICPKNENCDLNDKNQSNDEENYDFNLEQPYAGEHLDPSRDLEDENEEDIEDIDYDQESSYGDLDVNTAHQNPTVTDNDDNDICGELDDEHEQCCDVESVYDNITVTTQMAVTEQLPLVEFRQQHSRSDLRDRLNRKLVKHYVDENDGDLHGKGKGCGEARHDDLRHKLSNRLRRKCDNQQKFDEKSDTRGSDDGDTSDSLDKELRKIKEDLRNLDTEENLEPGDTGDVDKARRDDGLVISVNQTTQGSDRIISSVDRGHRRRSKRHKHHRKYHKKKKNVDESTDYSEVQADGRPVHEDLSKGNHNDFKHTDKTKEIDTDKTPVNSSRRKEHKPRSEENYKKYKENNKERDMRYPLSQSSYDAFRVNTKNKHEIHTSANNEFHNDMDYRQLLPPLHDSHTQRWDTVNHQNDTHMNMYNELPYNEAVEKMAISSNSERFIHEDKQRISRTHISMDDRTRGRKMERSREPQRATGSHRYRSRSPKRHQRHQHDHQDQWRSRNRYRHLSNDSIGNDRELPRKRSSTRIRWSGDPSGSMKEGGNDGIDRRMGIEDSCRNGQVQYVYRRHLDDKNGDQPIVFSHSTPPQDNSLSQQDEKHRHVRKVSLHGEDRKRRSSSACRERKEVKRHRHDRRHNPGQLTSSEGRRYQGVTRCSREDGIRGQRKDMLTNFAKNDVRQVLGLVCEGGGRLRQDELQKMVDQDLSLSRVIQENGGLSTMLERNDWVFSLSYPEFSPVVTLCSKLMVCRHYNTKQGCDDAECEKIHICKLYLINQCELKSNGCKMEHNFDSNHNQWLMCQHGLDNLNERHLKVVFKYGGGMATVPNICTSYNDQSGCNSEHGKMCLALHVCRPYIEGTCTHDKKCPKSHNILDEQPLDILRRCGIETKNDPRHIVLELRTMMRQMNEEDNRKCTAQELSDPRQSESETKRIKTTDTKQSIGKQNASLLYEKHKKRGYDDSKHMSKDELKELSTKPSTTILHTILDSRSGFLAQLNNDELNHARTELIMYILHEALSISEQISSRNTLLNKIRGSIFLSRTAPSYISNIMNNPSMDHIAWLLGIVVKIVTTLLQVIPSSITSVSPTIQMLNSAVAHHEPQIFAEDEHLREKMTELQSLQNLSPAFQNKSDTADSSVNAVPPEDYRSLPIFPSLIDIHANEKPFLRANKAKGRFDDLNHYLDVQFRLIREDFIRPIRDGVTAYLKSQSHGRPSGRFSKDLRLYHGVRFAKAVCTSNGISYPIRFDTSRFGRLKWKHSKRLIYGSLVCLSADNFRSVIFGIVCERDNLNNGKVIIQVEQSEINPSEILDTERFIMAETPAYFESYRHILKSLQNIGDTIPFQKYLVECRSETQIPKYCVNEHSVDTVRYNLSCLLDTNEKETDSLPRNEIPDLVAATKSVNLMDIKKWPDAISIGLDISQMRALHSALTREFAMIQGPPGTGKTFIGLKIVQTLLNNTQQWCAGDNTTPILIVCYTNHALDQFLEGITVFQTDGIVRVGGRSRSTLLDRYTLRNLKRGLIRETLVKWDAQRGMDTAKAKLIKATQRIVCRNRIIPEDNLEDVMTRQQYESLFGDDLPEKLSVLLIWLGLASPHLKGISNDKEEGEIGYYDDAEKTYATPYKVDDTFKSILKQFNDIEVQEDYHRDYIGNLKYSISENKRKQQKRELKQLIEELIRKQLDQLQMFEGDEAQLIHDVWQLQIHDRWKLYNFWLFMYDKFMEKNKKDIEYEFDESAQHFQESLREEDGAIMKEATILGMTTTGAAKYQQILSAIKPKIVIIEEAAEVLEAHIITTLSEGCEHLILIGDHQQLKPSTTVSELALKYNLKISLFERMINNNVPCQILENQHRMRPSISRLLRHIYPNLKDDDSVNLYDEVKGVSSSIFFLNHNHPEENNADTMSHHNKYEAEMIIGLCKYLLLQGYNPKQITLLTPYSGQLYLMKKLMDKEKNTFNSVYAAVVDNFQGEENDIILLSLVRSNTDGAIGFLNENNRVCVCLSRAKIGLYVMGNFKHLAAGTKLWRNIVHSLEKTERIGYELRLYCQNHPNKKGISVSKAVDFVQAPEGGCLHPCNFRLSCGHVCERICHIKDQSHSTYTCLKKCAKVPCENGHACPKICGEICGPCKVPMKKLLPKCQHIEEVPCYMDPEIYFCIHPCEFTLNCGHQCQNQCGEEHTNMCQTEVTIKLSCGHTGKMKCYEKLLRRNLNRSIVCSVPCETRLECEHICKGTCGSCLQMRLHEACQADCGRTLVCGHPCKEPCTKDCPPCGLPCYNRCQHSKCPLKCGEICAKCNEPCDWTCEHHTCTMLCHQPCNRPPCDQPCKKTLGCGHLCIGLCGETCPNKCRICNKEELEEIFFGTEDEADARFVELENCKHVFEVTGLDQWMGLKDENEGQVQLKACPKCKTPIWINHRYGGLIKQSLSDIASIKRNIIGNLDHIKKESRRVLNNMKGRHDLPFSQRLALKNKITLSEVCCIENSVKFEEHLSKIIAKGTRYKVQTTHPLTLRINKKITEAAQLRTWVLAERPRFSVQQLGELTLEITRLDMLMQFFMVEHAIEKNEMYVPCESLNSWINLLKELEGGSKLNMELENKVNNLLEHVKSTVGLPDLIDEITDRERIMIVEAMKLNKGHWFKCPKGHIYAIGDCGGATVESQCPECGSTIGGENHSLRDDNNLAPEMDGAEFPAFSDMANIHNFDPANL